jgi:ubiquinone/menaquinone biosynthesis C-methylase UbiE
MSLFEDNQFDIAFCDGMLEHICDRDDLEKICKEIRRVSKQYAIIVPWKYAFIEPHFKLPFFSIYPLKIQKKLILRFDLHGVGRWMKREGASVFEEHYQWLSSKEFKKLFPESKVYLIFFGLFCDNIAVIGPFK